MNQDRQLNYVQYEEGVVFYPFKDSFSLYLFRKIEKIALAIYLITEHLSEKEPIKQSIRASATSLISEIIKTLENNEIRQNDIQASLLEAESLLDLAANNSILTRTNVNLLKNEVSKISKEIVSRNKTLENNTVVKKSFFNVDIQKDILIKDIKDIRDRESVKKTDGEEMSFKDKRHDIQKGQDVFDELSFDKKVISSFSNDDEKKMNISNRSNIDRANQIIEIIKRKGNVMIKDISLEIIDCSEKTIQRELQKLVQKGTLKKEGERRWSTYSID